MGPFWVHTELEMLPMQWETITKMLERLQMIVIDKIMQDLNLQEAAESFIQIHLTFYIGQA